MCCLLQHELVGGVSWQMVTASPMVALLQVPLVAVLVGWPFTHMCCSTQRPEAVPLLSRWPLQHLLPVCVHRGASCVGGLCYQR